LNVVESERLKTKLHCGRSSTTSVEPPVQSHNKCHSQRWKTPCISGVGPALPSLPSNPQDATAATENTRYAKVCDSTFFRGHVSTSTGDTALLFSTDAQMQLLQDSCVVFVDSTFRVVPALYHQLFTIFVAHADYSFPVCYALMTRKTTDLCRAVLERLHQLAPLFAAAQLNVDFEDAPAAAFRAVFGEQLQISGCWFYSAQAVVRRMKKLGLQQAYTRQTSRHSWHFVVFSLSLCCRAMILEM